MKILFVYMGAESLGVEYLAASARAAGHEADLAFDPVIFGGHLMWNIPALAGPLDLRPKIVKRIVREQPDAAAFSCFSANYIWALSIAEEVKKLAPGVRTLFGGVHVSAVPERVIARPAVDALITGEADESLQLLLSRWEAGGAGDEKIPGVWEKRGGEVFSWDGPPPAPDVEKIPFPAKDIFYRKCPALEKHYVIVTNRGCPFNCTYCNSSRYSRRGRFEEKHVPGTKPVRQRSVESVVSELESAGAPRRASMVIFRDDVFNIMQREWLEEFAREYGKRIGLPYYCWTHPSLVSEENARLLRESGCSFISVGVQAADEETRARLMRRRYSNDRVRRAVALLKEQGITVSIDHIIGFPGDTVETLRGAAGFYNELRPERLQSYWLVYLPGTELLETACRDKHLSEADRERIEEGHVGFLFSSSGVPGRVSDFRKFILVFSLIPLLPEKWIRFLIRKNAYRLLPGATWANNIIVLLSALKLRDPLFLYLVRFLLSRKKVP